MSNVVNFPTKFTRDKANFEKKIRGVLARSPLSQEQQEELLRRLVALGTKYYREIPFTFSFSAPASLSQTEIDELTSSLQASLQLFYKALDEHFQVLIFDLYTVELELFMKEHFS